MNWPILLLGIGALILSILSFGYSFFLLGAVLLVIGLLLLARILRSLLAAKKISDITYNSIIEAGLAKIEKGNTSITREQFQETMTRIRDVLSAQQYVPEVGFDSVYLQYNSETAASVALSTVLSRGVKADLIQDKSTWRVRIQF